MYRNHWGLREIPFRGGVDSRFFYESPAHEKPSRGCTTGR